MKNKMKRESLEEFIARGGQIVTIPAIEHEAVIQHMNPTNVGPAVLLTYGEADLYYGETKARKTKKIKVLPKIDISVLPEALRKKYCKELLNDEED